MPSRYGTVAIILHWLIAVLVLANIWLGLAFTNTSAAEQGISPLPQLHKSIGLTVLVLSLARLLWRLANRAPAPLPPFSFLARLVHWIFYFLLIAVPLAGWALVWKYMRSAPEPAPTVSAVSRIVALSI